MPRRFPPAAVSLGSACSLLLTLALADPAGARQVTGLSAYNRGGQTFVSWDNLPGRNWTYHVVASDMPLLTAEDVWIHSYELGVVGDSSALDRRMSRLLGYNVAYHADSGGSEVPIDRGFFVSTPFKDGSRYYSVWLDSCGLAQDFQVVLDGNTLRSPVWEKLAPPRPIWQRSLAWPRVEDYVLFAPSVDTRYFPAMWPHDSHAFHLGVRPGEPGGALLLNGHGRGGSFFSASFGTGAPGETVLAPDDYLPTHDASSFYLGYSNMYDPMTPANPPVTSGTVVDYTDRFVLYAMDWAKANFGYDENRVYAMGSSMGGSFAFFMAWHHPERLAAAYAFVPKLCAAHRTDTAPSINQSFERMWSRFDLNLPTLDGTPVYDWMDGRRLAERFYTRGASPVFGFVGRNDVVVGWQEKLAYFEAFETFRVGGAWYWDEREHSASAGSTTWAPEQLDFQQLYRFRLDRSFPALTRCTADDDPGDGTADSGDPVGSLSGYVTWDDDVVDEPYLWQVVLRPQDLQTAVGYRNAPVSIGVDVTPRRLQRFVVSNRTPYRYSAVDLGTGAVVASGLVQADAQYVLTVPAVPVMPSGTRLTVEPVSSLAVGDGARPLVPRLTLAANPVRGATQLQVAWPAEGEARLELVDLAGRRARTLLDAPVRGTSSVNLETAGLAPGVYLLLARQGELRGSTRVVVMR